MPAIPASHLIRGPRTHLLIRSTECAAVRNPGMRVYLCKNNQVQIIFIFTTYVGTLSAFRKYFYKQSVAIGVVYQIYKVAVRRGKFTSTEPFGYRFGSVIFCIQLLCHSQKAIPNRNICSL